MNGLFSLLKRRSKKSITVASTEQASPAHSTASSAPPTPQSTGRGSPALKVGTPGAPQPPPPPPPSYPQLLSTLNGLSFLPPVAGLADLVAQYALGGVERTYSFQQTEPPSGRVLEDTGDSPYFTVFVPNEFSHRFLRVQRVVVTRWVTPVNIEVPTEPKPIPHSHPNRSSMFSPRASALALTLQQMTIAEKENDSKQDKDDEDFPSSAESRPLLLRETMPSKAPQLLRAGTGVGALSPRDQLAVMSTSKVYNRDLNYFDYAGWLDGLRPGSPVKISNKALGGNVRVFKVRVLVVCLYQYSPTDAIPTTPSVFSDSPIPVSRTLLQSGVDRAVSPPHMSRPQTAPNLQSLAELVMREESEEGSNHGGNGPSSPPMLQSSPQPPSFAYRPAPAAFVLPSMYPATNAPITS